MRIGEVIKITHGDIENTRITLWDPKSGSEQEVVFIQNVLPGDCERMSENRVFALTVAYSL